MNSSLNTICLVTSFDSTYKSIADVTLTNIVSYCNKWNIDFYKSTLNRYSNYDKYIPFTWNKWGTIKQVLKDYDWVVWIDIDCLFINFSIDIRSFLDDNYSLIISENQIPPPWWNFGPYIEAGIFFLKNTLFSEKFMNQSFDISNIEEHPWGDQYGMIKTIRKYKNYENYIKKINVNLINYQENMIGTDLEKLKQVFIYHVAGGCTIPLETKIKYLKDKLKYVY